MRCGACPHTTLCRYYQACAATPSAFCHLYQAKSSPVTGDGADGGRLTALAQVARCSWYLHMLRADGNLGVVRLCHLRGAGGAEGHLAFATGGAGSARTPVAPCSRQARTLGGAARAWRLSTTSRTCCLYRLSCPLTSIFHHYGAFCDLLDRAVPKQRALV